MGHRKLAGASHAHLIMLSLGPRQKLLYQTISERNHNRDAVAHKSWRLLFDQNSEIAIGFRDSGE